MQWLLRFSVGITATFLFALVIGVAGYAQSQSSSSSALPSSTANQRDSIDADNKLGHHLLSVQLYQDAHTLILSTIKKSDAINYRKGEGYGHLNLSLFYYATRHFYEAESEGKRALDFLNQGVDHARALLPWGQAVWARSDFNDAVAAFVKARDIFIVAHDTAGIGTSATLLALAEEERGNYDKSFQYAIEASNAHSERANVAFGQLYADVGDYETALDFYGRIKDPGLRIENSLKVGEVYSLQNNFELAKYYYQAYLRTLNEANKSDFSKPYALLGEMYVSMGKYDTALYYLNTALRGFEQVNDKNWVMRTLLEMGKAYNALHKPDQATTYLNLLLTNADVSGAKQYLLGANYLLYKIDEGRGDYKSAYSHLKEYTDLNKAIGITLSARKLAFFKASAQLAQAKLKIDLLNREKQLQKEELKRVSQQRMFILIGVLGLCLFFAVLIRNFYLKKKNADHLIQLTENDLRIEKLESNKKLAGLEMQVLRVQMNPHFIFNSLNSINRFIMQNNKGDASDYLTKFSRLIRMILQNSQSAAITLEGELDCLKLYLDLESLRFDHRFSYKIHLDKEVDISMIKVPPLVLQPFVENAIWHGLMPKETVGLLEIWVAEDNGMLVVKIIDDGVGRAKAMTNRNEETSSHRSLGMSLTSQRVKMTHNHALSIVPITINDLADSNGNSAGTEVVIILPVHYD
jgi:tetratricopeptide (TPR) repeat protein